MVFWHGGADASFRVWISNTELGDRLHFATDPGREDLATLLFTQAGTREVAFGYESNNVKDQLMFVENGVDDDWDDRCKEGSSTRLGDQDEEGACLEDGAVEETSVQ